MQEETPLALALSLLVLIMDGLAFFLATGALMRSIS